VRRIRNRCRTLIQINLFNFTAISPIAKLKVEMTKKLILVNLELKPYFESLSQRDDRK